MGQITGARGVKNAYAEAVLRAFEELHASLQRQLAIDSSSEQRKFHVQLAKSLRLQQGQSVSQYDHLVVYNRGFIMIENRSEPAELNVSAMGDWTQIFQGVKLSVPSPTDRLKRKCLALQQMMATYAEGLELSAPDMSSLSYDGLVAIPNTERFNLPVRFTVPEACKAAEIPAKVLDIILSKQPARSRLRLFAKPKPGLGQKDVAKIMSLLKALHQPAPEYRTIPEQDGPTDEMVTGVSQQPKQGYHCNNCGHNAVTIEHRGRYVVICSKCKQEAAIDRSCHKCGEPATIIKDGNTYQFVCESCHGSRKLDIDVPS